MIRKLIVGLSVLAVAAGIVIGVTVATHASGPPLPSMAKQRLFAIAVLRNTGSYPVALGLSDDQVRPIARDGMPICTMYGAKPTATIEAYVRKTMTYRTVSADEVISAATTNLC